MVFYECLVQIKPQTHFKALTSIVKQVSNKVVENGGIVRSIQNHGIRQFPHRVQASNPDFQTGQRYYEQGRFVSVYYDANPATQQQVATLLDIHDAVLRQAHLKARSKLDYISMTNPKKNPYVQKAFKEEQEKLHNTETKTTTATTVSSD